MLSQFAQDNTSVLSITPPVSNKWANYTGLNQVMYQGAVAKIKYQLQSQGFTSIADFSKGGDKSFFMQDTIHTGQTGWLTMDKAVNPFPNQRQATPSYRLNNQFLTRIWASYSGSA